MDYSLNAEAGEYSVKGSGLSAAVTRGAESWQFFAFVFAATLTFVLSLVDSVVAIVGSNQAFVCGLVAKIALGIADAYLVLFNSWMRNKLVGWLGIWKIEKH